MEEAKPKLTAPKIIGTRKPSYFMPRSRIIIVPKGDPRAYGPAVSPVGPAPVNPVTPNKPTILKAGVATSPACRAKQGSCVARTSCSGAVVTGICPGAANIICCTPKGSAPTPVTPNNNCPVYANAGTSAIAGNGGVVYQVVRIAPQHFIGSADNTMTKPTACAFARMAAAAARAGLQMKIASGFRTLARQQYFWNCYKTKKCNNGNLAASPGTSNHGRGKALDLNSGARGSSMHRWLVANAGSFGFRATVPSEPWHWEFM